ncbi:MAG: DUF2946 domain-containing protein [Burkholderiaceae bacterium]
MRAHRIHRPFLAWFTASVLLLGAFVSAVVPALRGAGDDGWVQVCTLWGSKWVSARATTANAASPASQQGDHGGHCPWCSLQVPSLELPPSGSAALALPSGDPAIRRAESALPPHQVRAWALAPSRAPPLHS